MNMIYFCKLIVLSIFTGACGSDPCQNGATCSASGVTFTCTCGTGYTGQYCEGKNFDE